MTDALWTARQVAMATGGLLKGDGDWAATGLSIDTRTLQPGDLFIALKAARDGHDFLAAAKDAGAAAALVSDGAAAEAVGMPAILVPDTLEALGVLSVAARKRSPAKRIAVTGSAGKTSTKEMLRAALAPAGHTHAADKSFNNHLGVPLTLASLPKAAKFGVFEIGMNAPGEILPLAKLVAPEVAIVTTVAAAHFEAFGSLEGIADEKASIYGGLQPGGVAIVPIDNPYADRLVAYANNAGVERLVPFGASEAARDGVQLLKYRVENGAAEVTFGLEGQGGTLRLATPGEHHAMNAMAVLAAGAAVGVQMGPLIEGLSQWRPVLGRGAVQHVPYAGGTLIILDESYNANPASMAAAFATMSSHAAGTSDRIAVLGEMLELGEDTIRFHEELAQPIAEAGVSTVVLIGGAPMEALAEALPPDIPSVVIPSSEFALPALEATLQPGATILFKGSNASGVHSLLKAFLSKYGGEG